jgi:hypothetical protein
MGVAAAQTAAPAHAPPVSVRSSPRLVQRACDCGAGAGLSGRCAECDRTGLISSRRDPARLAKPPPGALLSTAPKPLGHSLGSMRLEGNTVRVAKPIGAQARLHVSAPGDAAEQEAHTLGRRIAHMAEPASAPVSTGHRAALSRLATGPPAANTDALAHLQDAAAAGSPLPASVRSFMEPRFGADFGGVRIHTGEQAAKLAGQLSAQAFTLGRDIYFGRGQFQPDSPAGRELIAHELTHTIQQGSVRQARPSPQPAAQALAPQPAAAHVPAAPPATPAPVAKRAPASVQRLGLSDAWAFFANQANNIPGFRMLTIVLGMNPLTMAPVERSAANVIRALVEFLPGGGIVVQALQNSGVFDKVGAWVTDKLSTLAMTGSALRDAVNTFLGTLSWKDIFDLGGVWDRAKRIFTEPIDRLIAFVKGLATDILKFIKDAILLPLAKLAQGTRGWDLLIAVLGKNPITGDAVPQTAEALIGGFLKLIGQDEVWDNMKKANAIPRAMAWFQGAKAAVVGFVSQIPDLFMAAFKALTVEDVVLVAGAFQKVAAVFGGFAVQFVDWAGKALWDLLELIFDVVSPGALGYIKKTGAALKSILKDPLPFVGNLVKAAKLGFQNFASHFGEHLKTGLIDWLTGALPGVYIPKAISLVEVGKFALSVLGVSWAQIRGKIVKVLGPNGETIMKGLETGFDIVVALVKGGPAAAWELIKEKLTDLKDMVISGITSFVVDTIVSKAVPKLISMFVPGAGFISAILSIYDTVMVFVNKLAKIIAAVKAFVDSIVAIAAGQIEGAAAKVESTLSGLLSLAISFLAGFLGLGNIADKVLAVIQKIRATVDKAIDTAIAWIVGKAKALFAKLFGGKKDKAGGAPAGTVVEPFDMEGAPHTLTVKTSASSVDIVMASNGGKLYSKIGALKTQIAAQKQMPPARQQKIIGRLDDIAGQLDFNVMKTAFARTRGAAFTPVPMTEEFVRGYTLALVGKIVSLANNFGFKDLVAKAFLPDPLPDQRYIPDPVKSDIRGRLYERGSQWSSVRAAQVTAGIAAIDTEISAKIVGPIGSGTPKTAVQPALTDMKKRGKVLDDAVIDDFQPATSYVSPRLGKYAVDHDPSLAEHWAKLGGNSSSDGDRHAAVEGKSTITLDLVTRSFNSSKSSRNLAGELESFKKNAWIMKGFTSDIATDINNTPGNTEAVAIDGHSLTYPDGTPFVPTS